MVTPTDIIDSIKHMQKSDVMLIGIDGCSQAGKNTLSEKLNLLDTTIQIIEKDKFILPPYIRKKTTSEQKTIDCEFDVERLISSVIRPVKSGIDAKYIAYDLSHNSKLYLQVMAKGIIIIQGIYAIEPQLFDYYDLTIWVDTPIEVRKKRIERFEFEEEREGWFKQEEKYISRYHPEQKADIVYKGY